MSSQQSVQIEATIRKRTSGERAQFRIHLPIAALERSGHAYATLVAGARRASGWSKNKLRGTVVWGTDHYESAVSLYGREKDIQVNVDSNSRLHHELLPRWKTAISTGSRLNIRTKLVVQVEEREDKSLQVAIVVPESLGSTSAPTADAFEDIPLAEDAYYRETDASRRLIVPQHNVLSNQFAEWLKCRNGVGGVRREINRVDVEWIEWTELSRAELKICGSIGTTKSIREAIGQLLEYNFYGARTTAQRWWIVLDETPSVADCRYVARLRESLGIPLCLAWRAGETFDLASSA